MNITPYQNNNQLNFGSVNLIQVSKKAFKNPDNAKAAAIEFTKKANKATGENILSGLLTLMGIGKKHTKHISYLEQPGHTVIEESLRKNGNYSINWLSQNTDIPIKKSLSSEHHSFTILTKEHKDKASPILGLKNTMKIVKQTLKEGKKFSKNQKDMEDLWLSARLNQIYNEQLEPIIKNEPVNKFVIDDLRDLPKVFEKIDY